MTTETDLTVNLTATIAQPSALPLASLMAYIAHRNTLRRNGYLPPDIVRTFEEIILQHGREFAIDDATFVGGGEPKQCFMNSLHAASADPSLTYVEGYLVILGGIPIEHAWLTRDGVTAIDPTLGDRERDRGPYFGVPLKTTHVRSMAVKRRVYGFFSHITAKHILTNTRVDFVQQFKNGRKV